MAVIKDIFQETKHRFLNFFVLDAINKAGHEKKYFLASRAESIDALKIVTGKNTPDGVTIFALYGEQRDRVVLVRQYRYPINRFVYEFPSGIIDPGETYREAAIREMMEETGLVFTGMPVDAMYEEPRFQTIGMTDESCAIVYGFAEGMPTSEGEEEGEEIEVVIADREEVRRILREEYMASVCAYQLAHFLYDSDPFAFVRPEALIFDVDGTLWDAADAMARGWTKVINENYDPDYYIDGDGIRPVLGQPPEGLAAHLFPDLDDETRLARFHVCAAGELPVIAAESPDVYAGFREILPRLAERFKLFIVSNCDAGYIEMFLETTGLEEYFSGHLCPGDTGEWKADNIRTVMRENGIERAVYIGDTENDRLASAEAGVPFVFASYGYGNVSVSCPEIGKPADLMKIF